jgi:hypothetical protein
MTLDSKMFITVQWTTMPLRFLIFHSVVAMALDLKTEIKVTEVKKTHCH